MRFKMDTLRTILWHQFGATLDMFKQVLADCPDELWRIPMWGEHTDRPDLSEFWYVAYHTLFWLDLYLSGEAEGFMPPEPFTLSELDPTGLMPDRVYHKSELQAYLAHSRQKCRTVITNMTEAEANRTCTSPSWAMSFAELLIYNMRHVQEHGAQLRMILGQQSGTEFSWGARAKD
jgi:hypothetical protein